MDISIRTIKSEEIKYTYSQSHQLNAQTGCIGHLRGDMDSDGEAFYTSWDNAIKDLKITDLQKKRKKRKVKY